MPLTVCCMSHSPLLEITEQRRELESDVRAALAAARDFAAEIDPDVVVIFVPDHYNGFFHRLMPQFCLGSQARTVGDYHTQEGRLDVPSELALDLAQHVLDAGVDLAISRRMELDHATAQPLVALFGALDARRVIPIFVNAATEPLAPLWRSRALGAAVGSFFAARSERVLLIGSGGLSHDPPVPTLAAADEALAERLISGRPLTEAEKERKHANAVAEGQALAAGTSRRKPLSPEWDEALLAILAAGDLDPLDEWRNDEIGQHGCGAHEIRTWVAAYAALATAGPYETSYSYYRPIPEYIAGFGVTTAASSGRVTR